MRRRIIMLRGMRSSSKSYGSCKITRKPRIILKHKWSTSKLTTCETSLLETTIPANSFPRFKQRFKSLIDQFELRELHFHSLLRSKELEVQHNMARFDREKKTAEAEVTRSRALNAQVLTFSKTETELRNQLNIYVEKFKQVRMRLVRPLHKTLSYFIISFVLRYHFELIHLRWRIRSIIAMTYS